MSAPLRAAMTETRNAYTHMPASVADLGGLRDRLDDIREANVTHHLKLIDEAASLGVRLLCMGELFPGPYFALGRDPLWQNLAEDALEGPTVSALRPAAREHGMLLVAPLYELEASSGKRFNTAVVIDEAGDVVGRYRKTHIPAGGNEAGEFCEKDYYEPSDGKLGDWPRNISKNPFFPVFETSAVRLGIATCYDRHFPGAMQALADNGAELIVSPAVTFGEKSRRLWELEFPVDAARFNVFIGGSNRRGAEPPWNQEFFGASYFVGPNGRLPRVESPRELVIADLQVDELRRPDPSGWNVARDRRPDIYG